MLKKYNVQSGSKFGNLTVISEDGRDSHGHIFYLCLCTCGKKKRVSRNHLCANTIKSCGCLWYKTICAHAKRRRKPKGMATASALYNHYRAGAKRRNLAFQLNLNDFLNLTKSPCFYCGTNPKQVLTLRGYYGSYVYNGVDRLNNLEGYNPTNTVACCGTCNMGKRGMSFDDFKKWINSVHAHLKLPE